MNNMSAKVVQWQDIKDKAAGLNPGLVSLMDTIPNVSSFNVVVARYPFGDNIIDQGEFYLYFNGEKVAFKDLPDSDIARELDYDWSTIPFGLVTKHSTESHINHFSHIVPFMLIPEGNTFSLLTIFNDQEDSNFIKPLRSTMSGCRSLVLLPKINHEESNRRLMVNLKINQGLYPKHLKDQWELFKSISQSEKFNSSWYSEIILFSKDFIDKSSNKTLEFRHHLLKNIWKWTSFNRNQAAYDFIWSTFITNLNIPIKNDIFIIETIKHIIKISMGSAPGYVPAVSDRAGPITELTEVFLNVYKIRHNLPIFMKVSHYDKTKPIYYSLQNHTFLHDIPMQISSRRTVNDLTKIKEILLLFQDYILNNKSGYPLNDTLLYKTLANTEYEFFHPKGSYNIRTDMEQVCIEDPNFLAHPSLTKVKNKLAFPSHSPFFHGLIRIRPIP